VRPKTFLQKMTAPAHTGIAKSMGVSDAITNALRNETPLPVPDFIASELPKLAELIISGNPRAK
jgi:hypothetical protein